MPKQPAMDDMITFIRECANIEGTELGETWSLLLNLYHHRSCISNTTTKSLEKEIKSVYQYLKKESELPLNKLRGFLLQRENLLKN